MRSSDPGSKLLARQSCSDSFRIVAHDNFSQSPRSPLKGSFKGDIDVGIDIDVDIELDDRET